MLIMFISALLGLFASIAMAADDAQVDHVVVVRSWAVPDDLTLRVRITHLEPAEPMIISWRHPPGPCPTHRSGTRENPASSEGKCKAPST